MQRGLKKDYCSSLKGWFCISGLTCPLDSHLTKCWRGIRLKISRNIFQNPTDLLIVHSLICRHFWLAYELGGSLYLTYKQEVHVVLVTF